MKKLSILLVLALVAPCLRAQETSVEELRRRNVERIVAAAMQDDQAYVDLQWLCDRIGHRLAGSKALEEAVAWGQARMQAQGFRNVRAEKVLVPHWERLGERAELVGPIRRNLAVLALGDSVATPPGGLEAEVLCVGHPADLAKLADAEVQGRMVLFTGPWMGYGPYSDARVHGASLAARKGAVALLLKAFAPLSLDTPHTGVVSYDPGAPRIPAAGLSAEAAGQIERLAASGAKVRLRLDLQCRTLPDAESANVLGEFPGNGRADEIVVIGGHLDSWDVGQGAQDDGVGCVLSMQAAVLLQRLGLKPRRTVRVVLFTNEENGSRGGRAYLDAHRDELARHAAAIESDLGNGLIQGFGVDLGGLKQAGEGRQAAAQKTIEAIVPYLAPLGAGNCKPGWSGVDIGPIVAAGVPGFGARHDPARYWDIHHSQADTFDKIDKQDLRKNLAILAVTLYLLADSPERP